jgi:hypothetical protein
MFAAIGSARYSTAVHYYYDSDFAVTYINLIIKDPISGTCISWVFYKKLSEFMFKFIHVICKFPDNEG